MTAFYDALVAVGVREPVAALIDRQLGGGVAPQLAELRDAFVGLGMDVDAATMLATTLQTLGTGGGGSAPTIASLSALLNAGSIADRATFRDSGRISTFAGIVADTAALIAITNPLRVGDVVQVGSGESAADYRLLALPANLLSNWRNLGAAADPGGAVNVQSGPLAASATDAPNATAVIDAVAAKAEPVTTKTIAFTANAYTLSSTPEAAGAGGPNGDYNRLLIGTPAAASTITLGGSPATGYMVSFVNAAALGGPTVTLTDGPASFVVAPQTGVDLLRIGSAWADQGSAASVVSYGPASYGADITSVGGALLAEIKIPASGLLPGGYMDIAFGASKTGTASLFGMGVSVGLNAGSTTSIAAFNDPATTLQSGATVRIHRDRADPTKLRYTQFSRSPSGASTYPTALASVNAASAFSVVIAGTLFTAGDTIRLDFAEVTIKNPKVLP